MIKHMTLARFRVIIQLGYTLFCIYVGIQFAMFLAWALGKSTDFVAKPGAVEAFLPLSALLGFRQFATTGKWDMVHPAGLTIFMAIVTISFVFRKAFCGYVCPVGFISNIFERVGRKLGLAIIPNKWIDYPLMSIKYGLLAFFLYTMFLGMDFKSVQSFLSAPYNLVADAKMLTLFTDPTSLSISILIALGILSLVIRNLWCRYLCPYGALLGLLAWIGPTAIKRNTTTCINCGKCSEGCPSGIKVQDKKNVRSPECIGCAECIANCPVEDCLSFRLYGKTKIPWFLLAIGTLAVLLGFYAWGKATGHWDIQMPSFMLKKIYTMSLGGV